MLFKYATATVHPFSNCLNAAFASWNRHRLKKAPNPLVSVELSIGPKPAESGEDDGENIVFRFFLFSHERNPLEFILRSGSSVHILKIINRKMYYFNTIAI